MQENAVFHGKLPPHTREFGRPDTSGQPRPIIDLGAAVHRRHFLIAGSVALAVTNFARARAEGGQVPADKDKRLTVITNEPLVLETPDELLAASRVTPASALFVRNHHGAQGFCDMNPRPAVGNLDIGGLVRQSQSMPLAKLATMAMTEVEMVLQCSGNFRSQFSRVSPIEGTPWNKGAVGNVRFRGVPISNVFKAINLEIDPSARYLTARGADLPEKPGQARYEKSVPLDVALSRGLLATEMNGQSLPAVHGGPLRLVIPGYYGTVQVKWLTQLRLEATESTNYYQMTDYRTPKQLIQPGAKTKYTSANSDPNFDMKINCRLYYPADKATLKANEPFIARGVAWNDGAAALTSVELSSDSGRNWRSAELATAAGPFALCEWSCTLALPAGQYELWVRAVDAHGRTQPVDGGLFWNPGGYAWNGVEKITVTAK